MAEQKVKLTELPAATDTVDTAQLLINQNSTDQKLPVTHFLRAKNNLSDVADADQARANLNVPSVDEVNDKLTGYINGSYTFNAGANISSRKDYIWDEESKSWYYWSGDLPKDVPAASTPESTGGVTPGAWLSVSDTALRNSIAANDGEKLIGECPTIAILRTIEPSFNKQRITLREHTSGTGKGGGQFRAVTNGSSYTDNNGTVIKTAGGAAWLRINADILNPLMFGAKGDGVSTTDVAAVNACIANGSETDLLGLTYTCFNQQVLVDNNGRCRVFNGIIKDSSLGNNNLMYVSGTYKVIENITFIGTDGPTSRGVIVRGGSADITVRNNFFYDFKNYGIAIAYDYTNNLRCNRILIENNKFQLCGRNSTSFSRSTILLDQAYSCTIENNNLLQCNWGISFAQPFTPPNPTEPFGYYNIVKGNRVSGSGKTGNPYSESQGISAQSQKHLVIVNNIVEQFNGNGIDNQRCEQSTIQGNTVRDCYDGFFIGDMAFIGHNITGNNTVNCERGIRILNSGDGSFTGQTMRSSIVSNNIFVDSTLVGIYAYRTDTTGTMDCLVITGNVVNNFTTRSNTANVAGIQATGLRYCQINNNSVMNSRGYAIIAENCLGTQLHDNVVNGYDFAALGRPAVYLDLNCVGVSVRNLTSIGPTTSGPAVHINGTSNTAIGVRWRGPTSGILNNGTTSQVSDNFVF